MRPIDGWEPFNPPGRAGDDCSESSEIGFVTFFAACTLVVWLILG